MCFGKESTVYTNNAAYKSSNQQAVKEMEGKSREEFRDLKFLKRTFYNSK